MSYVEEYVENENTEEDEEDINLDPDNYSYDEAIELFEIDVENDNIENINIKYGTLINMYGNYPDYLKLIDGLYLKILNNDEDDTTTNMKETKEKNANNTTNYNNVNINSREALNFNNPDNKKYAVNQITPNITRELLCIDSVFKKTTESSSSFEVNLSHAIHNVIEMKIASAEIPESEYFFSEKKRNNVFYIIIYYDRGNKNGTFDINKDWIYTNNNNPSFGVIKVKIPDGIWYTGDIINFMNYLLDIAHGPDQNLMKFDIGEYSGKSIFRFKNYDELNMNQKMNVESADIYSNYDSSGFALPVTGNTDMFGPNAYFSLSVGRTYNAINNNDKYYTDYSLIQEELLQAPDLTEELFLTTSLYSMGFTLSQIYDNDLKVKEINKNSKFLTSKEKETAIISSINDIYSYFLESNYIYGYNKQLYAYIAIEDYVGNFMNHINIWNGVNSKISNKNIIARLQLGSIKFDTNVTDSADNIFKKRQYFGPVTIKKLKFSIINASGELIEFNGSNTSVTLEFSIYYNSQLLNTFNNILKNKN